MYRTLKVERKQKFVWNPDGIYRLDPKSSKNYRNAKSTAQNEHFPKKKYVRYLKNMKEPKNRMKANRWNLQALKS
jgi:hypothetical protein